MMIETVTFLVTAPVQPVLDPLTIRVAGALGALVIGFRSGVMASGVARRFRRP